MSKTAVLSLMLMTHKLKHGSYPERVVMNADTRCELLNEPSSLTYVKATISGYTFNGIEIGVNKLMANDEFTLEGKHYE